MDYPDIDHPSEADLVESAMNTVSRGHTGTICDGCNAGIVDEASEEDDIVYVWGDWEGDWQFRRTSCAECGDRLDDRPLVEAIVKCRVGDAVDQYGEFRELDPIDVVELNTSDGNVIRKQ